MADSAEYNAKFAAWAAVSKPPPPPSPADDEIAIQLVLDPVSNGYDTAEGSSFFGLTTAMTHRLYVLVAFFLVVLLLAKALCDTWSRHIKAAPVEDSAQDEKEHVLHEITRLYKKHRLYEVEEAKQQATRALDAPTTGRRFVAAAATPITTKPTSGCLSHFKAKANRGRNNNNNNNNYQLLEEAAADIEAAAIVASRRHGAATATPHDAGFRRRHTCDMMLVVYGPQHPEDKELARKLELIQDRLFSQWRRMEWDPALDVTSCSAPQVERWLLLLSTKPFEPSEEETREHEDDDHYWSERQAAEQLKERRIHRLLCRLATLREMNKRVSPWMWNDAIEPPCDHRIWDQLDVWSREGGVVTPDNTTFSRVRAILPFDEQLQAPIDPRGEADLEALLRAKTDGSGGHLVHGSEANQHTFDRVQEALREQQRLHSVYKPAARKEWLARRIKNQQHDTARPGTGPEYWDGVKVPELFTSMERIDLLRHVLERPLSEGGCGIHLEQAEVSRGWFKAVPLHDGARTKTRQYPDDQEDQRTRDRAETVSKEAVRRMRNAIRLRSVHELIRSESAENTPVEEGTLIRQWLKQPLTVVPQQPLRRIRDYFGVEIAMYFAFIQFLATWMLLPGLAGLVPMLGWVVYDTMDNWVSAVYSVFALVWCFVFIKYWRRRNRELAYFWNVEHAEELQVARYQFDDRLEREDSSQSRNQGQGHAAAAPASPTAVDQSSQHGFYSKDEFFVHTKVNAKKGNGAPTHFFDREHRRWHMARSWAVVALFLVASSVILMTTLSLRAYLMALAYAMPADMWISGGRGNWHALTALVYSYRVSVGSSVGVAFSSGWTLVSNRLGAKLMATWLTDSENHRTGGDYETALLTKKFVIKFLNSYSALLYIAFLKATPAGDVLGFTLSWFAVLEERVLGGATGIERLVERDYCHDLRNFTRSIEDIYRANDGRNPHCMEELSSFLMWTMLLLPVYTIVGLLWSHLAKHAKIHKYAFYDRQARLEPWQGITDECVDMVIQIGYVVLFAPAFPLAAVVVWLVNVGKQRADAYRLLKLTRRPLPRKVSQLFGLHDMLTVIGAAGLLTNIGLLFFTATQITALVEELPRLPIVVFASLSSPHTFDHFAAFVFTEHVLLLIFYSIHACILDDSVEISKLRSWSEHFEPKWARAVRALPKLPLTSAQVAANKQFFTKTGLGPLALLRVPKFAWYNPEIRTATKSGGMANFFKKKAAKSLEVQTSGTNPMDFDMDGSRWSIDPRRSWLLASALNDGRVAERKAKAKKAWRKAGNLFHAIGPLLRTMADGSDAPESHEQDARAYGRVSPMTQVTLTSEAKAAIGIPDSAVRFAFAYPLTKFADPDTSDGTPKLSIDLELELHDATNRRKLMCAECERRCRDKHNPAAFDTHQCQNGCARLLALNFLAVGGYAYFDKDNVIVMLSTLAPAAAGLSFMDPIVSQTKEVCKKCASCSIDPYIVQQLGRRLRERRQFCKPTLHAIRALGVIGFCWLTPGESVPGLDCSDPSLESEKRTEKKVSLAAAGTLPSSAISNANTNVMMSSHKNLLTKLNLERAKKEEARNKDKAEELWPDGAFVYMFESTSTDGPTIDHFHHSRRDPDSEEGRFYLFSVKTPENLKLDTWEFDERQRSLTVISNAMQRRSRKGSVFPLRRPSALSMADGDAPNVE